MKQKLSSIFNTRIFHILFSLVASIALWAYVGYGENSDEQVRVNNVSIDFVNAEELAEHDLVLTGRDQDTVNLLITGKRNSIMNLNNGNVSVVVDLADIVEHTAVTGSYQLRCQIVYPNGFDEDDVVSVTSTADYVTVTVEKLVSAQFYINAIYDGGPAEGYSAQPVELSDNYVTVSGPDSVVSKIAKVEARFSAYDFTAEVKQDVLLTLLDADGNTIPTDELTLDISNVTATIPVIMVKEVALELSFTACNSANSGNITYTIDPPTITLAGDAEILRDINVISLGTIDPTAFNITYSDTVSIRIPNGVTNLSGTNTASITVSISGVDITRLSVVNITYKNETTGIYYRIITQSLDVTLRGGTASLASVEANNVRIVADLAELGNATGVFSVPARVYVDGYPDIDATGTYRITVEASTEPFPVDVPQDVVTDEASE